MVRQQIAQAKAVYSVTPASFPAHNKAAHPNPTCEPDEALFVSKVPAIKPYSVLDIATGPGYVALGAAARGATTVVGLDTSEAMLDEAKQFVAAEKKLRVHRATPIENISFALGDASKLPVDSNSFDGVTMGFVMLHLPDPAAALMLAMPLIFASTRSRAVAMTGRSLAAAIEAAGETSSLPASEVEFLRGYRSDVMASLTGGG